MMKNTFFLLFFSLLALVSCKKEDSSDPIADAKDKLLGDWVSVKVTSNGTDITSTSGGTFKFKDDNTFTGTAVESGFTLPVNGTYEIKDEAKTLVLDSNLSGVVNYKMNVLTDTDLQLEITAAGQTRIADFKKQ